MCPQVGRPPKLRMADGTLIKSEIKSEKKKPRIFANWLECQQCDYKCRKRVPLQTHMLEEHNEIIYLCQHCEQMFKDKDVMKEHEKRVHGGVKYPCPQLECSYSNTIISELEDHVRKHKNFLETCGLCEHTADNVTDLNLHINEHHNGENMFCEHCTATATNLDGLKEHIALNHGKPSQTSCSKCEFETSIVKLLKCHEDNFHKTVEYKCSQCVFVCNWESSLPLVYTVIDQPDKTKIIQHAFSKVG